VRVFPVATGTAANALALASLGPSWGNVYCSEVAHINTAEAMHRFFGGRPQLVAVAGDHGKIGAAALAETLAGISPGQIHRGRPAAVSLTQATDLGAVIRLTRSVALRVAKSTRPSSSTWTGRAFANATAGLGLQPGRADLALRRRHHVLSARPKTAARCGDAMSVFTPRSPKSLRCNCGRAGQVWSKMRLPRRN